MVHYYSYYIITLLSLLSHNQNNDYLGIFARDYQSFFKNTVYFIVDPSSMKDPY